jgi:hypothetical protein
MAAAGASTALFLIPDLIQFTLADIKNMQETPNYGWVTSVWASTQQQVHAALLRGGRRVLTCSAQTSEPPPTFCGQLPRRATHALHSGTGIVAACATHCRSVPCFVCVCVCVCVCVHVHARTILGIMNELTNLTYTASSATD